MGRLTVIRHAKAIYDDFDIYYGDLDIPLSSEGIKQAISTSKLLPRIDYDIIYTSTLLRSIETASILAAFYKHNKLPIRVKREKLEDTFFNGKYLPIVECEELNERNYGILQTKNKIDVIKDYNIEDIFKWRRSYDTAPPEGESLEGVVSRVTSLLTSTLVGYLQQNKNILLVAHQNSIRALYLQIMKISSEQIEEIEFDNCTIIDFQFTKKSGFSLVGIYNSTFD